MFERLHFGTMASESRKSEAVQIGPCLRIGLGGFV